jgi:hypothetical protein
MIEGPEELEPAKRLEEQIRHAFEGAAYPEGDNIYDGEDYRDYDNVKRDFLGKNWQEIPPQTLFYHHDDMALFTRASLSYFLPAFLLEDLKEDDASQGQIQQYLLYQITDEIKREEIYSIETERKNMYRRETGAGPDCLRIYPDYIPDGSTFKVNGDGMTAEQICVVRDYLEFIHETSDFNQKSAVYYALLHHWRPLTKKIAQGGSN